VNRDQRPIDPERPAVLRWRGALGHRNFRLFWFGQLI
jgi:hypothetical protein